MAWEQADRDEDEDEDDVPRSLMLKTPLTVLLVRRCLTLASEGEAGASSTAESTLVKVWWASWTSADMVDCGSHAMTRWRESFYD